MPVFRGLMAGRGLRLDRAEARAIMIASAGKDHPPQLQGRDSGGSWFETCSGVWYPRRRPCGVAIITLVNLINWLGKPLVYLADSVRPPPGRARLGSGVKAAIRAGPGSVRRAGPHPLLPSRCSGLPVRSPQALQGWRGSDRLLA